MDDFAFLERLGNETLTDVSHTRLELQGQLVRLAHRIAWLDQSGTEKTGRKRELLDYWRSRADKLVNAIEVLA